MSIPVCDGFLFAVHLSDGILATSWQGAGFVLAGLLAYWGARCVEDDEIPRIALLTSVFFVASSVHLRVGPTSVHLLLNGLLGVMLGRRAGLAIPVGLLLQMMLLGHGGWGTLGVNSCLMAWPALAASGLFQALQRLPRTPVVRAGFVWTCAFLWLLCLAFSISLLATNPIGQVETLSTAAATAFTLQPALLLLMAALGGLAVWLEGKLENTPEFAIGLLVGSLAVLFTLTLTAIVLLFGGQEGWHSIALLVFVAHLPIVVVEGCVVGCAVSFLARVKPELIGWQSSVTQADIKRAGGVSPLDQRAQEKLDAVNVDDVSTHQNEARHEPDRTNGTPVGADAPRSPLISKDERRQQHSSTPPSPENSDVGTNDRTGSRSPLVIVLALGVLLAGSTPALAHRLLAECRVLPGNKVQVEAWFDAGGGPPAGATVQVFRSGNQLVAEGKLDTEGVFVFGYPQVEELRIVVSAGAGHRQELTLTRSQLEKGGSVSNKDPSPDTPPQPRAERSAQVGLADGLVGIAFLLALAAFILSIRNANELARLKQQLDERLPPGP